MSSPYPTTNQPTQTTANGQATNGQAAGAPMDALDKGVDMVLGKFGKGGNRATTEKVSDGVRSMFKKFTGRDVPVKDT